MKIVQAVTVDQNKVQAEIKKIRAEHKAKRNAEIARQNRLQKLAKQARRKRRQEQKRLASLKRQQKKLEQQRKIKRLAAAKKLKQIQKQQHFAQQRLADLQKQRQQITINKKNQVAKAAAEKRLQGLRDQIAAEQKQIAAVHTRQIQGEVEKYKALILNAIGQRWIMPAKFNKKLSAQLLIKLAPGGTVLNVAVLKSSGDAVLDRSVITAVWKSSPLPTPVSAEVFNQFRELHLTVRPEGLLG